MRWRSGDRSAPRRAPLTYLTYLDLQRQDVLRPCRLRGKVHFAGEAPDPGPLPGLLPPRPSARAQNTRTRDLGAPAVAADLGFPPPRLPHPEHRPSQALSPCLVGTPPSTAPGARAVAGALTVPGGHSTVYRTRNTGTARRTPRAAATRGPLSEPPDMSAERTRNPVSTGRARVRASCSPRPCSGSREPGAGSREPGAGRREARLRGKRLEEGLPSAGAPVVGAPGALAEGSGGVPGAGVTWGAGPGVSVVGPGNGRSSGPGAGGGPWVRACRRLRGGWRRWCRRRRRR
ncbi:hypothetical protein EDD29_2297 [Actinocorallia herbida]|uniref:Uncharacterized protein n=1 Tax=Actinocorallia herbida TaxID=58109 RepID=A0A3N1CTY2_9ACTN|nr:hypothetical protein EDD29_2297 [Actinocorallia herbida]